MFQFRREQFAALRRKKIGDGLIATYADGPVRAAWNDQKNYVVATDPLDHRTRFGFDEHGFIAAVASPTGRLWQIANYPDGKAAILKNPAGHQLGLTYTPAGLLHTIASDGKLRLQLHYNEQQKAAGASFPDGTYSSVEYTPWSAPRVVTNRLGLRDVFDYDEHRRLIALTDGNGSRTTFLYGDWSRPDRTVFPNESAESYAYNEKGFVTEIATEETSIDLEPDEQGRPVSLQYNDGIKISYKYDDQGRTAEASLFGVPLESPLVSKYAWNDVGQLESEQSGDASLLYEYDKAGRLVAFTYPSGEKIEYEWDPDSRLTLVRDWSGGEHRIEYAPNDRGSLLTAPNGLGTLTLLNNLGQAENIAVSRQGNALYSLSYIHDEENRVASLWDSAFGSREFRYDAEGQLMATDSQGESPSESFAYDGAGNLVDISGKTAQYDPANQIVSLGHSRYDYDRCGNLIRMDTAEGMWRFAWSARNLMIASESPAGVLATYAYDAFGRRIRKQRDGLTIDFVWAGEQMIGEILTTSAGVVRRDYLYIPGTYVPLAVRVDGQIYSYHCDHLGTPRMITASDGSTVWLADYASFGAARVAPGSFDNPLRAPGQYFDEETGLHYNRFRYYSPQLARYVSRDPLGFLAERNFYRYAGNNPTNRIDPLGLRTQGPQNSNNSLSSSLTSASIAVPAVTVVTAPTPASPSAAPGEEGAAAAASGQVNSDLNSGFQQQCAFVPSSTATVANPLPSAAPAAGVGSSAASVAQATSAASAAAAPVTSTSVSGSPGVWSGTRTKIPPLSDAATSRSLRRENESADILVQKGYCVEQNPSVEGAKNPDYRINGMIHDNYAPATSKVRNIVSTVQGKVDSGQASSVVINLADSDANAADLQSQLAEDPIDGLKQAIIIDKAGDLTIFEGK